MTLDEIFDTASDDIFDHLATSDCTFTEYDTSATLTVRARRKIGVQTQPSDGDSQVSALIDTVDLLLSELTRAPIKNDTITINSVIYTVQGLIKNDGRFIKVWVI